MGLERTLETGEHLTSPSKDLAFTSVLVEVNTEVIEGLSLR